MKAVDLRLGMMATLLAATVLLAGCASVEETAEVDTLTANVGIYSPPPAGVARIRVGVPAFEIAKGVSDPKGNMSELAADQLTTLAVRSGRFDVVERAQLSQVLKEQQLKGIVREDELAKAGQVRGAKYLLIGKVTNFRIKKAQTRRGLGFSQIRLPGGGGLGAFDYRKGDVTITTDCGVDIRLVNSTTGSIIASQFGEFKRTDKAKAIGIKILGVDAEAEADLQIAEDDMGKILRLALDEAMRKMLVDVDRVSQTLTPVP